MLPVLYSFRRCPFAMRARLAIDIAQVPCALREVMLANKPAALLAVSPKGTVPVWVDPSCGVIDESLDIMRHVLRSSGRIDYLPDPDVHHVSHVWLAQCDGAFKCHLDRYKYASRYVNGELAPNGSGSTGVPDTHATAHDHRREASVFIQALDAALRGHPHLAGAHEGWADIAFVPFVRQFRLADAAWFDAQPWAGVQNWLDRSVQSARFLRIMHKVEPWQAGDPGVRFPVI